MTEPDISEFQSLTELDELRRAYNTLQTQLRRSKARTEELIDAVYRAAKDTAVVLGNPPPVPKPRRDRRTKRAETALLHISDLHFGKATPSFDTQVAERRLK